jgi:hypothetical protein
MASILIIVLQAAKGQTARAGRKTLRIEHGRCAARIETVEYRDVE